MMDAKYVSPIFWVALGQSVVKTWSIISRNSGTFSAASASVYV